MTMLILMLDKDEENGQEEADEIIIKKTSEIALAFIISQEYRICLYSKTSSLT